LILNAFFWRGPVGFILCHLGLPNESQHPLHKKLKKWLFLIKDNENVLTKAAIVAPF
jgi:hypothetical protein